MTPYILVAYATYAGSTAEVAAAIGEVLAENGASVDVRPVSDVAAVDDYQAVVIGSPLHSGEWLPEALAFVNAHKADLSQVPVACFLLALRLRHDDPDTRRTAAATIEPVRVALKPVSIGPFAGAMDYSKLSAIKRLQVQTKGLPEGDWRDWDAICQWAMELRPKLVGE